MAGRGTDIVLGGMIEPILLAVREDPELDDTARTFKLDKLQGDWQVLHEQVKSAGGLHIIGTERHESRRIDNQLRGRSGRQGDPGSSRFYLSLEDPLLRIFAGDRVKAIMQRLKMPEGEAIESSWVSRSIESAQRKVEAHNFDIRKQLLEYDDVANDQRKVIYEQRNELLESADVSETITSLRQGVVSDIFRAHIPAESVEEQWDVPGLEKALQAELQFAVPLTSWLDADPNLDDQALLEKTVLEADRLYQEKFALAPAEALHQYESWVMLTNLDQHWREHLAALDHLRQGIHLRGYAQKNPKQEYKREAFELFSGMLESVKLEVTKTLSAVQVSSETELAEAAAESAPAVENVKYQHAGYDAALAAEAGEEKAKEQRPFVREMGKIGRNDPCPCGSGKKYKQCHGKLS
jgi:preprotein translocase subunit SecA